MTDQVRTRAERRRDTLRRLESDRDVWVATAQGDQPHLVPLSLAWDGSRLILATPSDSPTARNAVRSGVVRLALGPTRDVTIIDAVAEVVSCAEADTDVAETYRQRTGWDPRDEGSPHSFVLATPTTARAWRDVPELAGRIILRNGRWLDE